MLLQVILLLVGLAILLKGADLLVRGASSIARTFRISEFVVGLTVVSFGTSLPELVIGLFATYENSPDIIIGNVIGSNIANILLVLGFAAIVRPLPATHGTVWREIPFTLIASIVLLCILNDGFFRSGAASQLGRIDGIVLLGFFGVFIYYVAHVIRKEKDHDWVETPAQHGVKRSIIELTIGMVGLVLGGKLAVEGAVAIGQDLGLSEALLGLTVIAIGTSLPELATSVVAAYRKNVDIAVGNVVGSNIFNTFIVLGITSLLKPIPFKVDLNMDLVVMMCATVTLFVAMFLGRPKHIVGRLEGGAFVMLYIGYMVYVGFRG